MRFILLAYLKIHNTILLTMGIILYSRSVEINHLAQQKIYIRLEVNFPFLPSVPGNCDLIPCFFGFDYFRYFV